jgi:ubiquinone/menaquinone biosynthesis C-methylase UbiE
LTERKNQQVHDRLAGCYDIKWHPYIEATVGRAVASMDLAGDDRVLEVATGTGELIRRLRENYPRVKLVGADLSFQMLRQARAKAPSHLTRWVQASADQLPFRDDAFDWIVCVNGFHCFRRPEQSLQQMRRVLRPGGQLLLVDWCDDYLTCKLCSLWLRLTDDAFYHTYTTRACRRLLSQANFTIDHCDHFRVGWRWGMMWFVAH